jgi:hypothetical protein
MVKIKKIGGIRFLAIGRLNISYSFKRKVKRKAVKQTHGIYTLDGVTALEATIGLVIGTIGAIVLVTLA